MEIIRTTIPVEDLKKMTSGAFGDFVKAVVDVEKGVMAIDAELHSDLEAVLLDHGSNQKDIWGINLYPDLTGDDFIEFDSMINMRPSQGNMSRGVDDENIRKSIVKIVYKWVAQ